MTNLLDKFREFQQHKTELETLGRDGKVLIVDALNTYIRCFAATPTMNDDGEHIGGTTGFLRSVGLAIRQIKPTRVILAFDGKGGSQKRRKIYQGYKDNRRTMTKLNRTYEFQTIEEEQESMQSQLRLLMAILSNLPVTTLALENIEADDSIAYVTNLIQERDGQVYIMSTDKDFLQLVNDKVKVFNPVKKKVYTPTEIVEEYGIHPANFLVYRAIVGDKSDALDGVKGIAEKKLLKAFPALSEATEITFDVIYEQSEHAIAEVGKKALTNHLIVNNKDIIERNRQLMCLKSLDFSSNIKLAILEQVDAPYPTLNKIGLTKLFIENKLFSAFPNYDEWINNTWIPLNRFSGE